MPYIGDGVIDEVLPFYANTHDPTTEGNPAADADSPPTYRVYEQETGTPLLTGSMALLDDANTLGFYSEAITLSAANGFEVGKTYCIRKEATVNSIVGVEIDTFKVVPNVPLNGSDQPQVEVVALSTAAKAEIEAEVEDGLADFGASKETTTQTAATAAGDAKIAAESADGKLDAINISAITDAAETGVRTWAQAARAAQTAAPHAVTASVEERIDWLYERGRNRLITSATAVIQHNGSNVAISTRTLAGDTATDTANSFS